MKYAGLSVRIPTGNGWRGEKRWNYRRNSFALDSFFNPRSDRVTAIASCRYLLAAKNTTTDELFEEKASASGGSIIVETGQVEIGGEGFSFTKSSQNRAVATLNWAHIKRTKILFDMFFGVVQLPNNRRLDIEVYQTTGDADAAEKIFRSVTESLKFTENHLLDAGSKIVAEIKGKGLDNFLVSPGNGQGWDRESFFLIKDASGSAIGFTMELLDSNFPASPQNGSVLEPAPETRLNILAGSFYYIRGRYDQKQATLFRSDNSFDEFVWKSETRDLSGRSAAEIVLSGDGIMNVKEFDRRVKQKDFQISPAAIPEVLGEFTFDQMLDGDRKEICVDIIEADGKITPALITRTGESVFSVELLDDRGFSEQVFLDDQRRILKRLIKQEATYTLERTGAEDILREFPEQGSYFLERKDEMLESNRQQEDIVI